MSDKGTLDSAARLTFWGSLATGFISKIKNSQRFAFKKLVPGTASRASLHPPPRPAVAAAAAEGRAHSTEDDRHSPHNRSSNSGLTEYSDALSGTDMEASSRDDLHDGHGRDQHGFGGSGSDHGDGHEERDRGQEEGYHGDSDGNGNGYADDNDNDNDEDETDDHEDDEDYRKGIPSLSRESTSSH